MSGATYDVVVVGAGANGLVAAATLGQAGLKTLLLERGEALGGQGRALEFAPGFRAAPLSLDPGWLPPAIARGLALDGVEPAASEIPLSVAVEPGHFLTLPPQASHAAEAIRPFSESDAGKWPAFTERLRKLAGFLEVLYQMPAPDVAAEGLAEVLPLLDVGRKFRGLGREHMVEFLRTLPMSVWELMDDWFECAPLKAAVAAGGIQDLQQGPRSGGTGFVLLHHLVGAPAGLVRGRAPWRAGRTAFTAAAEKAATRFGATIRTGAAVAAIRVRDDAVAGLTLEGGQEIDARAVLSTADPARTLLDWVDPVWLDPDFLHAVRNLRHRACTAIALYALDDLPDVPGLAPSALNGLLALTPSIPDLERAADAAKYGTVSDRPHIEITVPSLAETGLAPEGRHVMVARAQYAPYRLRDGGWDAVHRDRLADSVTAAIARVLPGFESRVLHRAIWAPPDLEERFGLHQGSTTQGELALDQVFFMRPVPGWGRHATPIAGLYLGGAGTHPGPGVLGGPGWLAARRVIADRKRR